MKIPSKIAQCAMVAIAACSVAAASAQDFPTRPVRVVVTRPGGGASDIIARVMGPKFQEKTGQSLIVDLQPGANGVIASNVVAKALPDGYTLLLTDDAHVVNPYLYKASYDAIKDFTPIMLVATQSMLMTINPAIPAKTLQEFVALAKAAPGKYTYSSAGIGSAQHLAMLGIASAAGVDLLHVPYKTGAVTGAISGEVTIFTGSLSSLLGQVQSGTLRPLATTSSKRSPLLPDVPTVRESGIPYEFVAWEAFLAPAGTPQSIIAKLRTTFAEILKEPDVQKQLGERMNLVASTPEELATFLKAESTLAEKNLREAKVVVQ